MRRTAAAASILPHTARLWSQTGPEDGKSEDPLSTLANPAPSGSIGWTMEERQHFNESPGVEGEMTVRFDIATGRVRCYGAGFWSVRQTRAFFHDWTRIVRRIHAAGGSVSALVDMSEGAVQRAEVADFIATTTAGLYQQGDGIAMLVPNSLAKMQMRRVLDPRFHGFFLSRNAAETWLEGKSIAARAPHRPMLGSAAA
jgi:hypothetical protein